MQRIITMTVAIALFAAAPTWANLVTNPGFESGGSSPDDWGVNANASGYITGGTPDVDVHTGSRAIYLENPTTAASDRWFKTNSGLIPASQGQTYDFSFWVKTENLDADDRVILRIAEQDDANNGQGAHTEAWVLGDTDWTELTTSFTIGGAATTQFRLLLVFGHGANETTNASARATFDDVTATQFIPEPASLGLLGVAMLGVVGRRRR